MKEIINIVVTFFEAGFTAWAVAGFALDKIALGAVIGAGISAVWNVILKPLLIKKGYIKA